MKFLTIILAIACSAGLSFSAYSQEEFTEDEYLEKNVIHSVDSVQEKVKSTQDDKNVISDSDDRDEDNFVKSSENPLNEDAFDFSPDLDETRNL